MVRCNLSVLLAERNLKITRVSEATGISRTTLTSLANNYGHGIQFDTINKLCNFLSIKPDQLISYVPVDIKVKKVSIDNDNILIIDLEIIRNFKTYECSLTGYCYFNPSAFNDKIIDFDISIELWDEESNNDPNIAKENLIIINAFKLLTTPFKNDLENEIISEILENFGDLCDDCPAISFSWPNELL